MKYIQFFMQKIIQYVEEFIATERQDANIVLKGGQALRIFMKEFEGNMRLDSAIGQTITRLIADKFKHSDIDFQLFFNEEIANANLTRYYFELYRYFDVNFIEQLTQVFSSTITGDPTFQNTIAVNNPDPAKGGGDGDTVEELRLNTSAEFPTQLRAVTQEDYLARTLSMPSRFGKVSKAYVTKDDATFRPYMQADISQYDPLLVSLYVLGLDANSNLSDPSPALLQNIQTYLKDYRMLTDSVAIKPAYIINIGCNFDIVIRPNYTSQDVVARCILALQDFFAIDNWQINEPIILGDIYTALDSVEGVQTVKTVSIVNKTGEVNGYSKYSYDISAGTLNGVIYPSLDPSIFEVKFPNTDIQGRVVTM